MANSQPTVSIEPFRCIRYLGEGGLGQVFLAEHPRTGEQVAVKVMHPELTADPSVAARVLSDARRVARIDHPNVAKVLEAGTLRDDRIYIAVEYVAGRDLLALLAEEQALDYERVVAIGAQLCGALEAAHQLEILHLDLKPNNIRISEEDGELRVKLLDFGLSATAPRGDSVGVSGPWVLGTPEYWSPEQASAQPLDRRSDLYSLGIILYEALTGSAPFVSHSYSDLVAKHLYALPDRLMPPAHCPPIPRALQETVLECLAKDPGDRFSSARVLSAALCGLAARPQRVAALKLATREVPAPAKAGPPEEREGGRLGWPALAAALFGAGMGALVLALVVTGDRLSSPLPAATAAPLEQSVGADLIEITVLSEPAGAFVFEANGGVLLGETPALLRLSRGAQPLDILVRFPDGQRIPLRLAPDGPAQVFARAPDPQAEAKE